MGSFDPVSAAITAGGSLLSSIFGGLFGADAQDSANQLNWEMQQRQLEWNEDMWNKNNAYNTPAMQIARMKEAGLNPNLMYGQGTTGNSSSPAAGVAPAKMQPVNYMQGLMELPTTVVQMAQARLLDAQAEKVRNSTIPNEDYLAGFRARTSKDQEQIEQLRKSATYLENLAMFVKEQTDYYGADKSAQWNTMLAQLEQGWKRLAQDSARIAISKFEAETHRQVSYQQRHYLGALANLIGSQDVAQKFQNNINEVTRNGVILRVLSDALKSWNQNKTIEKGLPLLEKQNQAFWIDKIEGYLKDVSEEGRGWTDAIVPF